MWGWVTSACGCVSVITVAGLRWALYHQNTMRSSLSYQLTPYHYVSASLPTAPTTPRESNAANHSTQTDAEAADDWSRFATSLPPLHPQMSLSLSSLTDTIVRIYTRAEATVEVRVGRPGCDGRHALVSRRACAWGMGGMAAGMMFARGAGCGPEAVGFDERATPYRATPMRRACVIDRQTPRPRTWNYISSSRHVTVRDRPRLPPPSPAPDPPLICHAWNPPTMLLYLAMPSLPK